MLTRLQCFTSLLLVTSSSVNGYAFMNNNRNTPTVSRIIEQQQVRPADDGTVLQMGLFDGVREAFSAPALEQNAIDKERETPIDRWMGWSVVKENDIQEQQAVSADYVDSMDASNYVIVQLPKPMGIVFEENDADHGGIFVQSLKEDGVAFKDATIQEGDQLIGVNTQKVSGLAFDDALGAIVDATPNVPTKLTFFRGSAKQFYGPTGASKKWIEEFIGAGEQQETK